MIYFCCDELRRAALADPSKNPSGLNGIDFLEVLDTDAPPPKKLNRQRFLKVHFVNDLTGGPLTENNVRIEGGERITDVMVTNVTPSPEANVLTVEVNHPGDFSIYTLRLVQDAQHPQAPPGYDPVLSDIEFSFKVECPSDFDCKPTCICPPAPRVEPDINYVAKDYASFRRLMLDRMALLNPQWTERNAADLGVALVEALAFVGDYISYEQDAIGTEAYLGTARRRVSVRRHARLVDYAMHDGCNARAWVQIQVKADIGPLPKGTRIFTGITGQPPVLPDEPRILRQAQAGFETMHEVPTFFAAHNWMQFYTWTDERCCLPKGATSAELDGHFPGLKKGDVLILEEVLGPCTGEPGDADPSHRQAVRLTQKPEPGVDPLNGDKKFTRIKWGDEDALSFPLCISSRTDDEHGEKYLGNTVSVARGNIVLCDHGLTESNLPIPDKVPEPTIFRPGTNCDPCKQIEPVAVPPRYCPVLKDQPLTQHGTVLKTVITDGHKEVQRLPFDADASASAAFQWKLSDVLPAITLEPGAWQPKRDLLNSGPNENEFVAEIDTDGAAYLRFGDNLLGKRPKPGTQFTATYRVGNGVSGNVGAESLVHIVTDLDAIKLVRNPLAAQGGVEPETMEDVRQRAPAAFRTQERAVTEADYAEVTQRDRRVQRAAATFRWTGSWHTVFLMVDRLGSLLVDNNFKESIRDLVERYRMAGYDLEVDAPRFVSLQIEMHVCVKPDYFRTDVKAALLEIFSNRVLPDGRRGVFHPDNFTFAQTVYLSPLIAAAQALDGVQSVQITVFQRQGYDDPKPLEAGFLPMGRLEIARCDNDPNFAERGVFVLTVGGGK
jgi:Baseplate J-like protein